MLAADYVPRFAFLLNVTPEATSKAIETLAFANDAGAADEPAPVAAAALALGAAIAGDARSDAEVARATGVSEDALARRLAWLAERVDADAVC